MQMACNKGKKGFPALFFLSLFINFKNLTSISFNKLQIRNRYQKNLKKVIIMFMMKPVIRLINVNVGRSHSLGYLWRAFQPESLFDQLRAMQRDSVVFE